MGVREKTLKNGLGGQFGPFSKDAPVMKPDGSFEIVRISALERYKDKKWIITGSNGLDEWVPGFDKAAAVAAETKKNAEKSKFLGIFLELVDRAREAPMGRNRAESV